MKKLISIICRLLGFNRPKPKTRLGRCFRRTERCVTMLGLLYVGLHLFPQVLFAHSITVDKISIHSRNPLPEDAAASIRKARLLLEGSELFGEFEEEHIYICDSQTLFRLFSLRPGSPFAISVPITDNVFVASVEFSTDTARRYGEQHSTRSLSGVVAHELTHGLIRRRIGLIKSMRCSEWVTEGYCEYIAGKGSFPEEDGLSLFLSGHDDPSPSYRYFAYRKVVSYLINFRGLDFEELTDGSVSFEDAKKATQQQLRKARIRSNVETRQEAEGRSATAVEPKRQ